MSNMGLTVDRFYEQFRVGKLLGLKCESGHITVPPRRSCRVCRSLNLEVVELSRKGQIVSFTDVHVKSRDFPVNTPYVLAIVRLNDGGNLLGVVNGSESALAYGSSVSVKAVDVGEGEKWPRIFFDLI